MTRAYDLSDNRLLNIQRNLISLDCAHIRAELKNLDVPNCDRKREDFSETWGQERVTLIDIASYSGRLDILERANALHLDLYLQNNVGRCALHYAASEGHVDLVEWLMERSVGLSQLNLQDCDGKTALHLAVTRKHVKVVELLVNARVDVNIRDKFGQTPLHLAWINIDRDDPTQMLKYTKIVEILMSSPIFMEFIDESVELGMPVMHGAAHLNSPEIMRLLLGRGIIFPSQSEGRRITTPLHILAKHGFHTTMRILLRNRRSVTLMIESWDERGLTPLHVAVSRGHIKCAYALVRYGGSLLSAAGDGLTVIDILFRDQEHPVHFLTELIDAWVYTSDNGCTAYLDFDVLVPKGNRQMAVVSALMSTVPSVKQMNILQHPLVEAFLGVKWWRLGYFFVVIVIFQAAFIACLFSYGHVLLQRGDSHTTPRRMVFFGAITMLCHNILHLLMIPRYYAKNFETWFSVISASICLVVAIAGEFGLDHPQHSGQTPSWILQSVSVAILFACIQMMLLIGQFPAWGYYALMFSTVLKNVMKVFLAVVWVIVGFTLSFSILFHYNDQFNNPWKAFVRTVLMMMGEYEYSDLFEHIDKKNSTNNEMDSNMNQLTLLPITSRIVFLLFVMLASIVLMNLMIGLAVIDIQELMNEGLILRLMKQVESVTHLEQVTSHWIFQCRWVPTFLKTKLESLNNIPMIIPIKYSVRHGKYPRGISKKLVKKLFDVASKNRNLERRTQEALSHQNYEDNLVEAVSHTGGGVEEQKQEMKFERCNSARLRDEIELSEMEFANISA